MSGHKAIGIERLRTIQLVGVVLMAIAPACWAQSIPRSNVDLLGDLAVGCIGDVPDTLSSFVLETTERMPYLRPRLTQHWSERGHLVFVSDSVSSITPSKELSRLRYDPERASVFYESADNSRLRRTITLSIAHSYVAPSGLLLDDGRCQDEFVDMISRDEVLIVQRDPFPETRAEVPAEGSWRTWAEPVVLGAAVGLVAYLFFTIRSS